MSPLVRIAAAPYQGLIVCVGHQLEVARELAFEKLPAAEVTFWGHRCTMCGVDPVPGRSCANCGKSLHPQWPAVYCCTECALEDV